jgi:hypothetical protein
MSAMYFRNVSRLLDCLGTLFQEHVSLATKEAYVLALADLPLDAIHAACLLAMRHGHAFPPVAVLRTLARAHQQRPLIVHAPGPIVTHTLPLLADYEDYKVGHWARSMGLSFAPAKARRWREN